MVFTRGYESETRRVAQLQDAAEAQGTLSGIPISIKDHFDVRGEVTTAGSNVWPI
jgi:aspartyl-tRNA(Asn)/glutamyl-tRNA(Gln) amidotransferase subunit A